MSPIEDEALDAGRIDPDSEPAHLGVEMVDGVCCRFQRGNAAVGQAIGHAIVSKLTMKLTSETYLKPE